MKKVKMFKRKYEKKVVCVGHKKEGRYREYHFETLESFLENGGQIRKAADRRASPHPRNPIYIDFKMPNAA